MSTVPARDSERAPSPRTGASAARRQVEPAIAPALTTPGALDPASLLALQLTAGNDAVGQLLAGAWGGGATAPVAQRELPASQPAANPGSGVLPPGVSSPDKIAVQLGDDCDFAQHPVNVVSGGTTPAPRGCPARSSGWSRSGSGHVHVAPDPPRQRIARGARVASRLQLVHRGAPHASATPTATAPPAATALPAPACAHLWPVGVRGCHRWLTAARTRCPLGLAFLRYSRSAYPPPDVRAMFDHLADGD